MSAIPTLVLSEFGIDQGLETGLFNGTGELHGSDFVENWWNEMRRFEKHMSARFAGFADNFVPGDTPLYCSFTVQDVADGYLLYEVCKEAQVYLKGREYEASVVIASPLESPFPSGCIVLTSGAAWIEQDIVWWLYSKGGTSLVGLFGLDRLRRESERISVRSNLPWIDRIAAEVLSPPAFWDFVHRNEGVVAMGDAEEGAREYELASEIRKRVRNYYRSAYGQGIYLSTALAEHRIFKVECRREVCTESFVERMRDIIWGIDSSWAIRFMVFNGLCLENSYLGAFLILADGRLIAEHAT